jgi:hypothetical protein
MKNSQKGFAQVALVVIIAVIIAAGGTYYYVTKNTSNKEIITETNVTNETSTKAAVQIKITDNADTLGSDTLNGIYKNNTYGFQFSYTPELKRRELLAITSLTVPDEILLSGKYEAKYRELFYSPDSIDFAVKNKIGADYDIDIQVFDPKTISKTTTVMTLDKYYPLFHETLDKSIQKKGVILTNKSGVKYYARGNYSTLFFTKNGYLVDIEISMNANLDISKEATLVRESLKVF